MQINKLIQEFINIFDNKGSFELLSNENINEVVLRENVPDEYGVYIIYGIKDNLESIIYIGKSGTLKNNGKFKDQALRKRLTMKQEGMKRKDFFVKIINDKNYDKLRFQWFITYDTNNNDLPGYAEAKLIQAYVEDNNCLPLLNKSF